MKKQGELLKHSEYVRELKPLPPAGAFKRNPWKLFEVETDFETTVSAIAGSRPFN